MKLAILLTKQCFSSVRNNRSCFSKIYDFWTTDAGISKKKKKMHGSGETTVIISNKEMNVIMKIVQAREDSNILLKGAIKTIKNETKEQKGGF